MNTLVSAHPFEAWLTKMLGYSSVWLLGYFAKDVSSVFRFPPWSVGILIGAIPAMTNLGLPAETPLWFAAFGCMLWPLFISLSRYAPQTNDRDRSHWGCCVVAIVAVLSIIISLFLSDQPLHRTVPLALCPLICGVFSGIAVQGIGSLCTRLPHAICTLGRASYAVYLVHMPFIYIGLETELSPLKLLTFVVVGTALLTWCLEWMVQPKVRLYLSLAS